MSRPDLKWFGVMAVVALAPWMIAASTDQKLSDNSTLVSITGTGTAPQKTQLLTMTAGVETFAVNPERAWRDNARALENLRARLKRSGIDERDIRTANLNLQEASRHENGETTRGFEVRHNLTIIFRDVARTGEVLDALVDAGAKQISGPRFSWEAGDAALAAARAEAIRDANQRAHFYAKALGLKVRRVVTMRDNGGYASPEPRADAMIAAGPGTQVSPGQDLVRLSVHGEFELVR